MELGGTMFLGDGGREGQCSWDVATYILGGVKSKMSAEHSRQLATLRKKKTKECCIADADGAHGASVSCALLV